MLIWSGSLAFLTFGCSPHLQVFSDLLPLERISLCGKGVELIALYLVGKLTLDTNVISTPLSNWPPARKKLAMLSQARKLNPQSDCQALGPGKSHSAQPFTKFIPKLLLLVIFLVSLPTAPKGEEEGRAGSEASRFLFSIHFPFILELFYFFYSRFHCLLCLYDFHKYYSEKLVLSNVMFQNIWRYINTEFYYDWI